MNEEGKVTVSGTPAPAGRDALLAAPAATASAEDRPDALHGILVVAKPAGPTSHDVVALVRRLTGQRRIGHGGTLDPFASGVLPLFLGAATRVVEYHMADPKGYRAVICLGARSTTDDLGGTLSPGDGPIPDRAAVDACVSRFMGTITQRPPDYSAVKVGGRRAYELARRGEKPAVRERSVEISRLEMIEWDAVDRHRPSPA